MVPIYNGVDYTTVYMGESGEVSSSSQENLFGSSHSNGMQFIPQVANDNQLMQSLYVFDPSNLIFETFGDQ